MYVELKPWALGLSSLCVSDSGVMMVPATVTC